MRILFFGDINGRSGRDIVIEQTPRLRKEHAVDCVIANGENAAAGFGITQKICEDLFEAGVDVITSGNHAWDNPDAVKASDAYPQLIRPYNFPKSAPGKGWHIFQTPTGKKILVVNMMARLFMDPHDDPFAAMEEILARHPLRPGAIDAVFVDFHGEATSEKQSFARFLDGKVSVVVGTHTHVPTADNRILPKGTAYQTDVGMCGDYNSVIGMKAETCLPRFLKRGPTTRLQVATGDPTLFGVLVDLDDKTGLARDITPIRKGAPL